MLINFHKFVSKSSYRVKNNVCGGKQEFICTVCDTFPKSCNTCHKLQTQFPFGTPRKESRYFSKRNNARNTKKIGSVTFVLLTNK